MRAVTARLALWVSVSSCAGARGPVPSPTPSDSPAPPTTEQTPSTPSACAPDIATRAPDAERVPGFDIDGDGEEDLVFRIGHDMHGNSTFHFYRVDGACAVYLGAVEAFIASTPRCVTPPTGTVCRLSANVRMFHDDYQETFYEHRSGGFVEAGHGRYTPRPQGRRK